MIRNFFVLSPRGDTILAKQYRNDKGQSAHERSHTEALFRRLKFWNDDNEEQELGLLSLEAPKKSGDAPPVFLMPDGLTYFHVKRNGLIFGASTVKNVSPNTVLEVSDVFVVPKLVVAVVGAVLYMISYTIYSSIYICNSFPHLTITALSLFMQLLATIARIFKDYCGTLSEEALRKNFILCYELLDEMIDYGFPQVTRTENLKSFVYNEPIMVETIANTGTLVNPKTASASAVHKPVISATTATGRSVNTNQKNEIFVDILERLNVLFSNNGYLLNSTIDGCIQMKSYLAGNPELRLALNEDLTIGRDAPRRGNVVVDDMNFNDCVNMSEWETARTLSFIPPDGEFSVLSYRITGEFACPFSIFPSIEEVESKKIEITLMIRADMPSNHFGANVVVEMNMPKSAVSASCNLISAPGTGQASAEYLQSEGKIVWTMKKFIGGTEQTLRAKVTLNAPCTTQMRRDIGPVNMCFEIPMYNVSQLQVRYLRVAENMVGYTPYRWVRYVTQSSSYVCRL
jgi:AP-4 complex subunit mu-1